MMWKLANDEGSHWTWAHENGYITVFFAVAVVVGIFQVTEDFNEKQTHARLYEGLCVHEVRVSYLSVWL